MPWDFRKQHHDLEVYYFYGRVQPHSRHLPQEVISMKNTPLKCWVRAKKHYHFRFSRRDFSSHCLGVLFTSRTFKDLVLGLSWRGNPEPAGVGGVCQQRFGWWHRERKMLEKGCLRTTAFKNKTSFWCRCCLSISGSRWRPTAKTIPSMPYLLALKVSISQGKNKVDNWMVIAISP